MAPEQALGTHEIGPPVDVYALTVVLFELLTGRTPYPANTPVAAIMKSISDPLPMPRSLSPDIGEALELVILKGAAKEAPARFQSVASLRDALIEAAQSDARAAAGRTTLVPTLKRSDDPRPREDRRRRVAIAVSVAAIGVAAGAALWSLPMRQTGGDGVAALDTKPSTQVASVQSNAPASAPAAPALDVDARSRTDEAAGAPAAAQGRATQPLAAADKHEPERSQATRSSRTTAPPVGAVAEAATTARNEDASASIPTLGSQPIEVGLASDTRSAAPTMTAAAGDGSRASSPSGGLDQVRKGETTQGDLIRLFGGPNLTTFDEVGRETWIYEQTLTQTDVSTSSRASQATARLGLFFRSVAVGAAADKSSSEAAMTARSTVRSVTVIVKFAPDRTVDDYAVRETYF
jgi:serine/threonine-protein kinase